MRGKTEYTRMETHAGGDVRVNPWRMYKVYKMAIIITLVGVVNAIITRDTVSLFLGMGALCLLLNGPIIRF
jgi:hypothetical protein